jgi:DNA-binding transcriptional MocR family regulator
MKTLPSIDTESRVPRHLQAWRILIEAIRNGVFPCGTHLPDSREIAARMKSSLVTARRAIARLVKEGWIERNGPTFMVALEPIPVGSAGSGATGGIRPERKSRGLPASARADKLPVAPRWDRLLNLDSSLQIAPSPRVPVRLGPTDEQSSEREDEYELVGAR